CVILSGCAVVAEGALKWPQLNVSDNSRSNLTEMLCDVCKCNDATVFLTQILEGKMQKVNLCDACSKEKGVQDPTGFALADLLLGIGAAEEIEKGAPSQKCPVCGFTQ